MGVANVTEVGNSITIGNAVSALMAPAFVKSTCMMNLMSTEGLPAGTLTKKWVQKGSLTAVAYGESATAALAGTGELTDQSATSTISKCAVVSGVSVEAQQMGNIGLDRVAAEQGAAIGRFVDTDALSLFSGFATVVTATSVMTIDNLMLAQFNIFNSNCPEQEVPLAIVLNPRAYYNVKKEIIQAGASVWTNQTYLDILGTNPQPNCHVGSIPGLGQFYTTTGMGTSGGDTYSAVFHPKWALAGSFAPAPITWFKDKGSEGFYTEVASYYFYDVLEFNDLAGVAVLSDT